MKLPLLVFIYRRYIRITSVSLNVPDIITSWMMTRLESVLMKILDNVRVQWRHVTDFTKRNKFIFSFHLVIKFR